MTIQPIYTLRRSQCRFPVTKSDINRHLFCGEPVEAEGAVYCAAHAARCYDRRPSERRKADAERAAAARAVKKALEAASTGARPSNVPKF